MGEKKGCKVIYFTENEMKGGNYRMLFLLCLFMNGPLSFMLMLISNAHILPDYFPRQRGLEKFFWPLAAAGAAHR